MTPSTSIDTCKLTFLWQRNNFYYWLVYLFRIVHNNSRSTKSSTSSYNREIYQHSMTYMLNILEYFLVKWKQLKYQNSNSPHIKCANGQFCKIEAPIQPLTNPPSCITAIYARNNAGIAHIYSLQIRNTHSATVPTPITSNLWILTSTNESDSEGFTLICHDQAPKSISIRKPIHVLCLPPVCSAISQHFQLPPHYKNHKMMINILLNTANLNAMNISSPEFWVWQHLEDHWNKTQLHTLTNIPVVHL